MVLYVKCLAGLMTQISRTHIKKPNVVEPICNPRITMGRWEVETGESPRVCWPASLMHTEKQERSCLEARWRGNISSKHLSSVHCRQCHGKKAVMWPTHMHHSTSVLILTYAPFTDAQKKINIFTTLNVLSFFLNRLSQQFSCFNLYSVLLIHKENMSI